MTEPTGHCPYLGLKQNRAIRFASPTSEHRCYISGDGLEIPVEQSSYCLSQNHVRCPLYTGLMLPTTSEARATPLPIPVAAAPSAGLRGWYGGLSPRDRAVYAAMLAMLAVIVAIYLIAGYQSFFDGGETADATAAPPAATTPQPTAGQQATAPTAIPPTPTDLPTSVPTARPTERPTQAPILLPPTSLATQAPTAVAVAPTQAPPPTAQPTQALATTPPTRAPATARPTQPPEAPTRAPVADPTRAPAPTEAPPPASVTYETLTLYFGDTTGTLYVPVQRRAPVENREVAKAAVRELIAGPRNGLVGLLLPDTQLLDLRIDGGTAIVNFDRWPTGGGDSRGFTATVLTLTEFASIQRVQFQINGQNVGPDGPGPVRRPVVNPINPDNLPADSTQTEFLPLYFLANDGYHDIRLIRMVPKTRQTAEGTIRALLEGPGQYSYAAQRTIPEGTELRGIRKENDVIIVDFTQRFAETGQRDLAVRSVVQSLTTLQTVRGVMFLVEGRSLAEQWGDPYGQIFTRRAVNPE